jgi:phosphoenolpyruvate carboxykinase (GTP)
MPKAYLSAASFLAGAARARCRWFFSHLTGALAYISVRRSETTAAAAGLIGTVRRDPMAMRPFCGYHMGDYFRHWIKMQRSLSFTPRIFHVNWFRKDESGSYLWPGYQENMRVLKWIVHRVRGRALSKETPIGWMPRYEDIEWSNLSLSRDRFDRLQELGRDAWRREVMDHEELFITLHDHLPEEMIYERELLICRCGVPGHKLQL